MSQTIFVPLTCPACGGDLAGRASDVAAFCSSCRRAFRCDRDALSEFECRHVVASIADPALWLPVWSDGHAAAPAFLTVRPLMLARLLSRAVKTWTHSETLGPAVPVGARLPPESLPGLCRLAELPEPRSSIALLAVPATSDGVRIWLPGETIPLYSDDVVERSSLLHAIHAGNTR